VSSPPAADHALPHLEGATRYEGVALEKALDVVSDVFVLFDKEFRIVYHNEANKAAMRAAGLDPDAAIGKTVLEAMPQIAGSVGERESRRAMEERIATEWEESYHPDVRLRGRAFPLEDGGLIVVASNISAEWRAREDARLAAERATRFEAVTADFRKALRPEEVAHVTLSQALEAFHAIAGIVYLLDESSGVLRAAAHRGVAVSEALPWSEVPLDSARLIADAVRMREPYYMPTREVLLERYPVAREVNKAIKAEAWAAIPLVSEGRTLGGICLGFDSHPAFDADQRMFIETFAAQCAQAMDRARLYQEAQLADERLRILAHAADRLIVPLDLDVRLRRVLALMVPSFCDWGVIYLLEPVGALRRAAVQGATKEFDDLLGEIGNAYSMKDLRPPAVVRALQEDTTVTMKVDASTMPTLGIDKRYASMLARFGPHVVLAVPMHARGTQIGALLLGRQGSSAAFSAADVGFIVDLSIRAAGAIDNARLFASEHAARSAAEEANRAKSDFLAAMSHELRTPLNAIAGYTELLSLGIRGPLNEQQHEDLRRIARNQAHLLSIINDILSFARIEAGYVDFTLEPLAARDVISSLEQFIAPQLAERRLGFSLRPCDASLVMVADRDKTQQVLLNLLTNAAKFTAVGGEIHVHADEDDATIGIHVTDTGIGIPSDRLDAIFEPFVQVHRSLTHPISGTGLGLSISRDIARKMGGDIGVKSTLGQGSTFTLLLPRHNAPSLEQK
jgi:signal transduction histidine kinase